MPPPMIRVGDPTIGPEMHLRSKRATVAAAFMVTLVAGVLVAGGILAIVQFQADSKPKVPKELQAWADGAGQTWATNRFVVRMPPAYAKQTEVLEISGHNIKLREAVSTVGDTMILVAKGGMDAGFSSEVLNSVDDLKNGFAAQARLGSINVKYKTVETAGNPGLQMSMSEGDQHASARVFVLGTDLVWMITVGAEHTNDVLRVLVDSYEQL
jgi:hypothetical protein